VQERRKLQSLISELGAQSQHEVNTAGGKVEVSTGPQFMDLQFQLWFDVEVKVWIDTVRGLEEERACASPKVRFLLCPPL
jgi:hypothetical protein